jgi:uncharacterized protein (TIGR00297 family)
VPRARLIWQSKLILLLTLPFSAAGVVLQAHWWFTQSPPVAIWALGLSLVFALIAFQMRAADAAGAGAGAILTADLMFSTATFPYQPWFTAVVPVLALFLLSFAATRLGRAKKERLGTAERRQGRSASQVAANLGAAALVSNQFAQNLLAGSRWASSGTVWAMPLFAAAVAALAEAAADTVSSEAGQVLGGLPRLITTWKRVEPGRDGAVSLAGTLAGVIAAGGVAAAGTLALHGGVRFFVLSCGGAIFGFLIDSLLGAALEERGWLNNDAVNFLSSAAAAALALVLMVLPG